VGKKKKEKPNHPSSPFKEKEMEGEGEGSLLGGRWKEKEKVPLLGGQWCRNPNLAKCAGEAQHLEKLRIWSPPGLPNV